MTDEERAAAALVIASALVHFTTMAQIENKDGKLVKVAAPSPFQVRIYQAYEWLLATGQPVRIIAAPKPRQSGGSTAVGHICYHHTRRYKVHGMMMADEYDRTKKIWSMFQRFADNDTFTPFWDSKTDINTEEARFTYRDENGHNRTALWENETANDPKAGASGTRRVLWFSEAMRYKREGDASDERVIGNALNSLPYSPGTVVFLESTAEGPGGFAYKIWQGASTLAQRIAGEMGNGWVKVFCAWHECPDYALDPRRPENVRWFSDSDQDFAPLRDAEEAGRIQHGWTREQIAWRRMKIVGESAGALFDRDYPDTEETAFRTSSSQRFNPVGLARLTEMSEAHDKLSERDEHRAAIGWMEEGRGLQDPIMWTRDDAGPLWVVEAPIPGCRYIGFADPATGAQADGSATRDGCSAGVMRLQYTDARGIEHPDEPVALLHGHNGTAVHWDNDIVVEALDILLRYYGDPPVNVESNNAGVEVIRLLGMAGRTVCRRKRRDHKNPGKLTEIVGFQTTAASKQEWVGALAQAIREQTLDCRYSPATSQLATFILDEKGRGCAQSGCHDDHVTGLGLALIAKHWAKVYPGMVVTQTPGPGWRGEPERTGGAWS